MSLINDDNSADFVTMLSSNMIADVMQVYFDTELYTNKKVKIVDLKPQGDWYAFSLAFVQTVENVVPQVVPGLNQEEWDNFHRQEAIELKKMVEDNITYDIYDGMPDGTPIKRHGKYTIRNNKGRFVRNASTKTG